jgi:hypothetical protein
MLALYRALLRLPLTVPTLALGDYERVWSEDDVVPYIRTDDEARFMVALDLGGVTATLPGNRGGDGRARHASRSRRPGSRWILRLKPSGGVVVRPSRTRAETMAAREERLCANSAGSY